MSDTQNPRRARVFELLMQSDPAIDGPKHTKALPERSLSHVELEQLQQTAIDSFTRPRLLSTRP